MRRGVGAACSEGAPHLSTPPENATTLMPFLQPPLPANAHAELSAGEGGGEGGKGSG